VVRDNPEKKRETQMPISETITGNNPQFGEVLTLPETAAYLRVSEEAVAKMATDRTIPAQRIGNDWRFLRKALNNWLTQGDEYRRRPWRYAPEFYLDSPFIEELLTLLERRLVNKLKVETGPEPGSKEAVSKYFGIWRDDPTAQAMLEDIYKRRGGG
jgi:excisionase family DNA binding protein